MRLESKVGLLRLLYSYEFLRIQILKTQSVEREARTFLLIIARLFTNKENEIRK